MLLGGAGERGFRSMVVMIRVFRFTRKGILVIVVMLVLVTVRGELLCFWHVRWIRTKIITQSTRTLLPSR